MAGEPVRTWTSTDGRTLQAQYIESSAGKVTIKDGESGIYSSSFPVLPGRSELW